MPCAMKKPYSTSPSHQLIRMIISQVFDESQYHIVIFGTCGIVPSELETMYPVCPLPVHARESAMTRM